MTHTALIIGPAYPFRGGIAAYNERLAREFQNQGDTASLLTFTLQYPEFLFPGQTQYSEDPPPGDLTIRRTLNSINPVNWLQVGARTRDERPDLVVIKYWLPFLAPCYGSLIRFIKRNHHTKIISILDNVIPHEKRPGDTIFTRYFLNGCDAYIYMSKVVGDDLRQFEPIKPAAFNPHPLYDNYGPLLPRDEALRLLNLDPAFRYALFFGFIREYKGLDILLQAFRREEVQALPLKLIVAGEFYENPEKYQALMHGERLQNRIVHMDKFVSNEDVNKYFSAADLVIQPYKHATQSGVTQIAYNYEKPMIVTDVGGLSEIVSSGKTGYIVERTPEAITGAIVDFFSNKRASEFLPHLREEKKRFTWDTLYRTIIRLYEEIS